jgi:Ca2+-transporting ATPase
MGTKDLLKKTSYHTLSSSETLEALETSPSGLTKEEARSRLSFYGGNVLEEGAKRTLIGMFGEQFKNPMIIVLLGAALIAGFLGEITDAIIILVVVLLNAVLGVAQESKAEKALAALKSISSPLAKVKREGQIELIKASEIVPGDIIALEAGDYVPADLRLLETHNLKIEEAALTGESVPAEKQPATLEEEDLALGDRSNMAYLGSSVVYGRGTGVAIATGMETEIGKIAGYLTAEDPNTTPLQKKLAELSKYLTAAVILICGLIFVTGLLRGNAAFDIFLTSVSLAVAAIPEGLPAVITIVLALGVQRMARRKAIIRRLPAVETLGSTQIICSDKTGTLTQNKMTVKQLYFNDLLLTEKEAGLEIPGMEEFLKALVLCNDSKINFEKGELNVLGDPTETALIYFALAKDFAKDSLEKEHPRIDEVPFDSDRKLMTTINKFPNSFKALTKGAPDVLLTRCSSILLDGKIRSLTPQIMHKIEEANRKMASKALRVLAVACKELDSYSPVSSSAESQGQGFKEQDLVFLGLVGMIDPPREEAKEAVRICQKAGIKPIMITGDHPETAAAIARELNIINNPSEVITGRELDKMKEEEEFKDSITKYSVYARVSPENKVQIVKAWKEKGKVVAMTGME